MNNQTLEAIALKMAKIENSRPNTYQDNFEWKRLSQIREKISINLAKQELAYHKQRLANMGEKDAQDSVRLIPQLERYLERKEKRVEHSI